MKRITLLIAFAACLGAVAQEETPADTTKIHFGDLKITIHDGGDEKDTTWVDDDHGHSDKAELTHWGGVDMGVNLLLNKDGNTDMSGENEWLDLDYAHSFSWSINVAEVKVRLIRDYVGIVTGAGLTFNNYGLQDDVNISSRWSYFNADSTQTLFLDSTNGSVGQIPGYSKNKLRTSFIKVPLMLEFNTSKRKERSFHVAAGLIGGWRIGSSVKQKFQEEGVSYKVTQRGDLNLRNLTLDGTVRVGYSHFTLFMNAGLTTLFQDEKGPEVYPLTVGLQLIPW